VGGVVTSVPAGIRFGRDRSETYAPDTVVTLTLKATRRSRLTGWSGACSGAGPTCLVTMNDVKIVKASFE
jgi:hypothetical protein